MSWPLASHFSAMLQNPKVAFRDPELQACVIEKDERGQPRPWSGAFAVVYKGTVIRDGRALAVRAFTTESSERHERYDRISEYLKTRQLKCLVDFEYRDRSIRSAGDGKWYPLVTMDWVEGDTLFKWARARSLSGDGPALAAAAERWIGVVGELADSGIAHGDLQHANVMVTPSGELKLVDYDCMCVPALVGRRNLEVGIEPYQHPDRNETTHLGPDLDNCSALVVYVALRALAADPSLWHRYVEEPAYDKLLFRGEDFRAPASSALIRDLTGSADEDVRELTEQLFGFWGARLDQVPALADVTNSYAKVQRLLLAREWEAAVRLLNRRGQFRDAPPDLKPLIHQAYEYVCRQKAWAGFERIPLDQNEQNDRHLAENWNEALFASYEPAERLRGRVEEARHRVALLDRLRGFVEQASGATSFAKEQGITDVAEPLPEGYEHGLRGRVERARKRVRALEAMDRAVRETDDEQIAAGWRLVVRLECEGLVDADHRARVALAERRLPLLTALRAIPEDAAADELDRRLLDVWREDLPAGCPEIEAWEPAYERAVCRRDLLRRLEDAVGRRDAFAMMRLLEEPALEDYPLPAHWDTAVRMARDRAAGTESLGQALQEGDRSSFLSLFDVRLIREHHDRFEPYHSLLGEWTRTEVLPLEGIGLRPALGRASLVCVDRSKGTFRARWTWPQQRFSEACILAICPEVPAPGEDPRDVAAHYRAGLDRENWESGGGSRLIHAKAEWENSYVVVWATVDLGFRLFLSHPLVLGRLDETAGKRGGRKGRR